MKRCGDFGGVNAAGKPCRRVVVDGLCARHFDGAEDNQLFNQESFLDAYQTTGTIVSAAKRAGVHRNAHSRWMREDETYPARFMAAKVDHRSFKMRCSRAARATLLRRLVNGTASPAEVFHALRNDPDEPWLDRAEQVAGTGVTAAEYADQVRTMMAQASDLHTEAGSDDSSELSS